MAINISYRRLLLFLCPQECRQSLLCEESRLFPYCPCIQVGFCRRDSERRLLFLSRLSFKAKFQSQPWLWALKKPVHEGHGRSAVSPEPAHQNTEALRGGCQRGRLLPVSRPRAKSLLLLLKTDLSWAVFTWSLIFRLTTQNENAPFKHFNPNKKTESE